MVPHPEPDHLGDGGLVLPQGPQVSLLLEGGDVVIDVQDVDPDPPRGLLAAAVAGDDGQRVALRGLKVQPGSQDDHTRVLVQGEAEGTAKERGKSLGDHTLEMERWQHDSSQLLSAGC